MEEERSKMARETAKKAKKTTKKTTKEKKAKRTVKKTIKKAAKKSVKKTTKKKEISYKVPLEELLEAGCHFGHQSRRWNPQMAPFIWKAKDGIHVFDLVKTKEYLEKACLAAREMVADGGTICFIGTKRQAQAIIAEEAQKIGVPYIVTRWPGGFLTNWVQIKKSIKKLLDLRQKKQEETFKVYTKKENILIDREIARLERIFGGLTALEEIPQGVFIVDIHREKAAVKEAIMKELTIFGIVDSNANPKRIDYPIPANDDAVRSIKLIVSKFAQSVGEGKRMKEKNPKSEIFKQ